ncbi:MFS transporter permease [Photobacterium jeanii]|uniref:MFS transporter permease n=1 Tax=Photobacterium jeanii TaxID=858640 RepID=A0A178KM50_9GAMM|nr:DUF2798 domain-containing protein [Photobacterium jeanii]OAN18419.1 MFS transporter permease [Photobacterium jeanii]PST91900.1 DUF2798 domain-containing protein [Photobacterium jeanii]
MSRKQQWLTSILSSLTMASMMSGLLSGYKLGFSDAWPAVWGQSFMIGWPCALILNLTVLPQVRAFCAWVCRPKPCDTNQYNLD